jgi:hypothetical protein
MHSVLRIDDADGKSGSARPALDPKHREDLQRSGLSDEQIRAAGLYSESNPATVVKLLKWGITDIALGPCLVFPFVGASGERTNYCRLKPTTPRKKDGKLVRYESPKGIPNRAYFPPGTTKVLADPAVPLVITEGEKKALKADQDRIPAIGLVGVWGWQKKRPSSGGKKIGPRELIPDLTAVAWRGRTVYIAFDSDAATKSDVRAAEKHLASALGSAGANVTVVRLPADAKGEKVGLDDYLLTHTADQFRALAGSVCETDADHANGGDGGKEPPAAVALVKIALACCGLWHDPTGTAYASRGRRSDKVRSKTFKQWLVNEYRKLVNKVPNANALADALATIEAAAVYDGAKHTAHVRVAGHNGNVYLHLADDGDTVIEIGADGWRECDKPPVRFYRPPGMLALPKPERGGSLDSLRSYLNVPDESAFALVVAWLVGCFRPAGPFPLLVLLGEQGSAKSTTARVLKALIDPSAAPVRCEPKEGRDLMISARNNHAMAFDNLSHLPVWLSDAFCRLATGGGFATRELYSDDGEVIFDAKRPLVLNGITDFVTRADLLERSLLIRHPPIPEANRRPESSFWSAFATDHPKLLGALSDRVSAGLRGLPTTQLDRLPRMADFALFAVACERGSDEPERFVSAYTENQCSAHAQALDASPIAAALVRLMADRDQWQGTGTELCAELARFAPDPQPRDWPRAPHILTGRLQRDAADLRSVHNLVIENGRHSDRGRTRFVRITRPPDKGGEEASGASEVSGMQENKGVSPDAPEKPKRPTSVRQEPDPSAPMVSDASPSTSDAPQKPKRPAKNAGKTRTPDAPDAPDAPPPSLSASSIPLGDDEGVF